MTNQTKTHTRSISQKILIICMVIIGTATAVLIYTVIANTSFTSSKLSFQLCGKTENAGIALANSFQPDFPILSYDSSCLTGAFPTPDNQGVTLRVSSSKDYDSRAAGTLDLENHLQSEGWVPVEDASHLIFSHENGYTLQLELITYAPLLAKLVLQPKEPGLSPTISSATSPAPTQIPLEQALRFVKVPAYISEYIPAGYSQWNIHTPYNTYDSISASLEGKNDNEYRVMPTLRTSLVPEGYDITENCDLFMSGSSYSCELFTTTPKGLQIYIARRASNEYSTDPVAIVNGYLVSLLYGYEHPYVSPTLSKDDIAHIFDSLNATNTPAKY